jgi:hypothetical protein
MERDISLDDVTNVDIRDRLRFIWHFLPNNTKRLFVDGNAILSDYLIPDAPKKGCIKQTYHLYLNGKNDSENYIMVSLPK